LQVRLHNSNNLYSTMQGYASILGMIVDLEHKVESYMHVPASKMQMDGRVDLDEGSQL